MIATTDPITAARAAALFVSCLSVDDQLTTMAVRAAIQQAMRAHGGSRGCAADMAAAYGDHPELAVPRMRWARAVVDTLYVRRAGRTSGCASSSRGRRPATAQRARFTTAA